MTLTIVVVNVAVFLAMLSQGAGLWHASNDIQLNWGANFGPATIDSQWWRLGTAMFLHFGLLHLAFNIWALWDSCRFAERLYGSWRLAAVYVASGMGGNLLSLLIHGDQAVSGGASGAIFGAYGALLIWLWRERRQVHPVDFRWLFGGGTVFSAIAIGAGLLIPGIDNAAHVGGLGCGVLAGRALALPFSASSPAPGFGRWCAAGILLLAATAMVAGLPAPKYRWSEEQKARAEIREFLADEKRMGERLRTILQSGNSGGVSFEDLASRIDSDITRGYQGSFNDLSAIDLDPASPSASTLEHLKRYANQRSEASHALAQSLLQKDSASIRKALEELHLAPPNGKAAPTSP